MGGVLIVHRVVHRLQKNCKLKLLNVSNKNSAFIFFMMLHTLHTTSNIMNITGS